MKEIFVLFVIVLLLPAPPHLAADESAPIQHLLSCLGPEVASQVLHCVPSLLNCAARAVQMGNGTCIHEDKCLNRNGRKFNVQKMVNCYRKHTKFNK